MSLFFRDLCFAWRNGQPGRGRTGEEFSTSEKHGRAEGGSSRQAERDRLCRADEIKEGMGNVGGCRGE